MKRYEKYIIVLVLAGFLICGLTGCKNDNKEKEAVSKVIRLIYNNEYAEGIDGNNPIEGFPNDEVSNELKEFLTEDAFSHYMTEIRVGRVKLLNNANNLHADITLKNIKIDRYTEISEGTVYKYEGDLEFDYIYGDKTITKKVLGQITVGELKSEDGIIKELNNISVPENVQFFENSEIKGKWKVYRDTYQEKVGIEGAENVFMKFNDDADISYINGDKEDRGAYVVLDSERIEIFQSDARWIYTYKIDGDKMVLKKYKEDREMYFEKVD